MLTLTEIIPWEKMVAYEKEFNERTGLNSCIIDQTGQRVTAYRNWANPLCPLIRGETKGSTCTCSKVREMLEAARPEGDMVISTCEAGMIILGIPVYKDGFLLGIMGGCGMLPEDGELNALAVSITTGLSISRIKLLCRDIGRINAKETKALGQYLRRRLKDITGTFQNLQEDSNERGIR